MASHRFPPDFLWGTAIAGHQVEGHNHGSDWWAFELERGLEPSAEGCDFLHRFEDDLDSAQALGTNALRLSLEWSRVEPRPGQRDSDAVGYYHRLTDACLERGIQPMLSLVHFTLPRCYAGPKKGWLSEDVHAAFRRHVRWVAEQFGDRVSTFATVNEPTAQAAAAYVAGVFPPGLRGRFELAERMELGLLRAHASAYWGLHERIAQLFPSQRACIGPAQNLVGWRRWRFDPGGILFRRAQAFNWRFLDAIHEGLWYGRRCCRLGAWPIPPVSLPELKDSADFIGINYYTAADASPLWMGRVSWLLPPKLGPKTSDMGLPIVPEGFEEVLYEAHLRYRRPIIVTENGIADASDRARPEFLRQHLKAMERAMKRGVDVRGYFHWSLLDNFEWHHGYWPRFGLIEVKRPSLERHPRPSAQIYAELIRHHQEKTQE
ncbi:MAG: family 1 glycosylhydrolase [Myxococcota bacterium]|jgi:beta-glucosidase|nr:family 1 glycosylhydrolase [Myxococcota bacterium]